VIAVDEEHIELGATLLDQFYRLRLVTVGNDKIRAVSHIGFARLLVYRYDFSAE